MATKRRNFNINNKTALYFALSVGVGIGIGYGLSKLPIFQETKAVQTKSVAESTKLYKANPKLYNYIMKQGNRYIPELQEIHDITYKKFGETYGDWITSKDQCYLLGFLCKLLNVKKAIEVGVFTGSSALCIAKNVVYNGNVIAIDHHTGKKFTDIAQDIFRKTDDVNNKISLRLNGGIQELDELIKIDSEKGTYDFAYVDAMKTEYIPYYEKLLVLIRKGGLITFDNTLLCGRVADLDNLNDLDDDHRARVEYIAKFNEHIAKDKRVEMCMISIGDGLTLIQKK